jgi:hypothetical protein
MNIAARQTNSIPNNTTMSLPMLAKTRLGTSRQTTSPCRKSSRMRPHSNVKHTTAQEPKYVAAVLRLMKVDVTDDR